MRMYRIVARTCAGALVLALAGCATLQQVAALRDVAFRIDGVTNAHLVGISLGRIGSYRDLTAADAAQLALAVANRDVPLSFDLHVEGTNPAENTVTARLLRLDWTLLIDDAETVSGTLDREILLPPGKPTDIPVAIRLDLYDFFQRDARGLLDLALNLAGQGGAPTRLSLRATPTIQTPIGPIRYPEPITIVSRSVGGGS